MPPKQREVQCFVWDITIDNEGEHCVPWEDVVAGLNELGKRWVFQRERGEVTGKEHYQCRISLNEKQRLSELKQLVPSHWHLSKTSNDNKGNRFYVSKDESRVPGANSGPWRDTPKYRQNMPYQWRGILENPRPFQAQIMSMIGTRDDRKVHVVYDPDGSSGKSSFANRLEFEGKCYNLVASKNTNEMCADLCDELEDAHDTAPGIIFVDMERAADQEHMGAIFAALERIKGGVVKDRRYKLRKRFYDSPPVVVFMNQLPFEGTLSKDRWTVWKMLPDKSLQLLDAAGRKQERKALASGAEQSDSADE